MTVTSVVRDAAALSLTVTAEFAASPERVWQLWQDPRQLERWWGPPGYPATFTTHDLRVGGRVDYHLTAPGGAQPRGYWDVMEAEPPRHLVLKGGFSRRDGSPNDSMPRTMIEVTIAPVDAGRTRMELQTVFPDVDAMNRLIAMGMEPGLTEAVGQIDAILAETIQTPQSPEDRR